LLRPGTFASLLAIVWCPGFDVPHVLNDPFDSVSDVLDVLRILDGGDESVVGYDREDPAPGEESPEIGVDEAELGGEVARARGEGAPIDEEEDRGLGI